MKVKLISSISAVLLLGLLLTINVSAESINRADGDDIKMLLSAASGANSAYWATYIGQVQDRAYIEYETLTYVGSFFTKSPKRIIYWVPLKELSKDNLVKFIEYKEKYERDDR